MRAPCGSPPMKVSKSRFRKHVVLRSRHPRFSLLTTGWLLAFMLKNGYGPSTAMQLAGNGYLVNPSSQVFEFRGS